jgi:L-ascorbate metabolism protein UlaG (beta-lactamase superfamily)
VRHRYSNLDPAHRPHRPAAILRWGVVDPLLGRRRRAAPGAPAAVVKPDLELIHGHDERPRLTWIGHASFLGGLGGRRFLIDPVFSDHAGLLYRRYLAPGLMPGDLPPVSAVLVTHNHFDHLDADAVRALPAEVPVVVPAGLGRWLRSRGRRGVVELAWWESAQVDGLVVTLVPARHWSRRGVFDTNRSLWGGYVVEAAGQRIYHAGDTAWFDGFAEIARRFPGLLAALLPIGGYQPAWFMERQHLNPEQAGTAFLELGASQLVPMHWGTFQLTDEPLSEPAERIREWWRRQGPGDHRRLRVLAVGETLVLE